MKVIQTVPTVGECTAQLGGNYLDNGNPDWTCCVPTTLG